MLDALRRIMSYQMTIAEWIGAALMVGLPYLALGLVWAVTQSGQLQHVHGVRWLVTFLASVASWPVLLVSNVCMT
jgi:hypothetical protein